jgi:NAD(P)-dependent dehydrogenase (short-subunit alcohol dehydrogenase family)
MRFEKTHHRNWSFLLVTRSSRGVNAATSLYYHLTKKDMSKKVLITGASGGFGKLIVSALIADGHKVAASMRGVEGKNKTVAAELRKAGAEIVEMDVTDEKSVNAGVERAIALLGGLDVVINNAGRGVVGMQEHFTPDDFQKLFDINVFGVQRVNRAVVPFFRKQRSGLILYTSSLLGRITLPFYGPYNASKWALEALAENYRVELSGFGIENCIVEPGGFPTTFMENLMSPSDLTRNESYGEFIHAPKAMFDGFEQALHNNPAQNPALVGEAIANLIAKPAGQRPFRTTVDKMGMGDHVEEYNEKLAQITNGLYSAFGIQGMLAVKA